MSQNQKNDHIKIIQANLHRAAAAMDVLAWRFVKEEMQVALIQEPWATKGKLLGIPLTTGKQIFDKSSCRPRAAIILSQKINYLTIPLFIRTDLVAILAKIPTPGGFQEVIIASAYLPGEELEAPPDCVKDLVRYSKDHGLPIILGCDANAHHIVWGSSNNNKRGESLLEYLTTNNLDILNRGCAPTFINKIRQEVLDLTITSPCLAYKCLKWHVSKEASLSDHKHICFEIQASQSEEKKFRNPKRTNWTQYQTILKYETCNLEDTISSPDCIDLQANQLVYNMINAYEQSCPISKKKGNKQLPWWNEELATKRKETRKLFNRAKTFGNWEEYKKSLTEFNNLLKKSKRESWRKLCEEINELPVASRLQKVLSKDTPIDIGLLEKPDGSLTTSSSETLEVLLATHFPGCKIIENQEDEYTEERIQRPSPHSSSLAAKIFTPEKIKWAINSFKPFKSAGVDKVFPALLQQGLEILMPAIIRIFKASFIWGYIPKIWRKARVVFIPKAGNRPIEKPKSYRPISLTSFFVKTMEKLVDYHIRTGPSKVRLHPKQHAYQKGKSTESALHDLVRNIEKAIEFKEIALCAFLDIEGAFDNTPHDAIIAAARKKGIEPTTTKWIHAMLKSRMTTAAIGNSTLTAQTYRGCPQGGVLSPLLWSIVVDELLDRLTTQGFETIGYADDLVIIIRGKHDFVISERLQLALNLIMNWCQSKNLNINPTKTDIIPFTNRRKIHITAPSLNGITIPCSNKVKYLGITLDRKLNWNSHLETTHAKALRAMWACKSLFGRKWGLQPKMIYWCYRTIILPIVTYGATVWWTKTLQLKAQVMLQKIQRLACLGITGAMRTCPTASMEMLLNLPPIHLQIKKEAARGMIRIQKEKQYLPGDFRGHLKILNNKIIEATTSLLTDIMPTTYNFEIPFKVIINERKDWQSKLHELEEGSTIWYTDGSRTKDGTGAGVKGPNFALSKPLGKEATIFQAELIAMELCIQEIIRRAHRNQTIYILSDSQAVLKALLSHKQESKLVWSCLQNLKILAKRNKVTLMWVPGHIGVEGNEEADRLAKEGATTKFIGPEPFCGKPRGHSKLIIHRWVEQEHRLYWNRLPGLKVSKKFIQPQKLKVDKLLNLSKKDIRTLTGLITGHHPVNYHLKKMGLAEDDKCRLCLLDKETTEHLLCTCEAAGRRRLDHLGKGILTTNELAEKAPEHILRFYKSLEMG